MRTSKKMTGAALFLAVISFAACTKDNGNNTYDCTGVTSTYTADVKPIMDNSCALSGCHSAASSQAGFDLSSYNAVKTAAGSAKFMGSMEHNSRYEAMPRGAAKLSDANLKLIACWINNGMPQ
jgi:hypothetical protein